MMFAAPVALAALGGWATGTMAGASIGWLVGSWLFSDNAKDKSKKVDPQAQGAPAFNTAIRGQVIPVLFGTNRVPSQIAYQGNFVATRVEGTDGASGGKGGGSGMGGKGGAAGQSTSDSFTYKIDAIYHLGQVPEPYNLFGGWLGAERLDDATTTAIAKQYISTFLPYGALVARTKNAGLSYDEAVYFPGNNPEPSSWAYLTSQVGAAVRFPSTAWVGFAGLNLGGNANMPQISWEIGPGAQSFDFSSAFVSKATGLNTNVRVVPAHIVDNEGNALYVRASGTSNVVEAYSRDSVLMWSVDTTSWGTALNAFLPGLVDTNLTFVTAFPILGGQYTMMFMDTFKLGDNWHIGAVCQANPDSAPTILAVVQWERGGVGVPYLSGVHGCEVTGLQTADDPILIWGHSGISGDSFGFVALPSVNTILLGITGGGLPAGFVSSATWLASEVPYYLYSPSVNVKTHWVSGVDINFNTNVHGDGGWCVPYINGLSVETRYYFLLGKGIMKYNDPAAPGVAPNPFTRDTAFPNNANGNLVYFDFGAFDYTLLTPDAIGSKSRTTVQPDPLFANTLMFESDGSTSDFPWLDEYHHVDGTAGGTNQYNTIPYLEALDGGGYLLIFGMFFTTDPQSVNPDGIYYANVRLYLYNPLTGHYTRIAWTGGPVFSANADWGDGTTGLNAGFDAGNIFFKRSSLNSNLLECWGPCNSAASSLNRGSVFVTEIGDISVGGGGDVTPPYIIKQILTNPLFSPFGTLIDSSAIDTASYVAAVNYCVDEGILVSTQYRRSEDTLQTIALILSTYGGFLTISNGLIKFGLMDTSSSPVRTIDNNHLLVNQAGDEPVRTTKGAQQDTANRVLVNYIDRSLDYGQNQVEEGDEVDQDITGIRTKEFPPQFVMSETTARKMALRALYTNLYARDTHEFMLGPKDHDLEPGDVITLVDSYSNLSQNVRITRWAENERLKFTVTAMTELGYAATIVSSANASAREFQFNVLGPVPKTEYVTIYELPAQFSQNPLLFLGWVPDNFAAGARLYVSADGTSYAPADRIEPYPIGGRLLDDLTGAPDAIFDLNKKVVLFPNSLWPNSAGVVGGGPTLNISQTLNDVSIADMHFGAGLLWVGSEMIAYEGLTLVDANEYSFARVYRGWGGTPISAHNSGDYFVKHGGGIFTRQYTENQIGTTFHFKLSPYNIAGLEYPVSSLTAYNYTIQGRWYRPQNPAQPQVNSQRGNYRQSFGGTGDITLNWVDSARRSGFGMGGFGQGAGGYGAFVTDTLSHGWRINVVGSGGLAVNCFTVNTPAFTYFTNSNVTDNGAWNGHVALKVTPFSPYGDAPRSAICSLELF